MKKLLNYCFQDIAVKLTCLFLFRHYEAQKDSPDIQWKVGRDGLCFEESVSMQIASNIYYLRVIVVGAPGFQFRSENWDFETMNFTTRRLSQTSF